MKDQVLCAIDFSESSVQSIKWANKLALGTRAHLNILFSYRLIQADKTADVLSFKRKTEEEARIKYAEIEKTVLAESPTSRTFITEIGFFPDNIENFVRKNPSSIIVMSEALVELIHDHKNETLMHFLKGLDVPLLVVPDGKTPETDGVAFRKQSVRG